MYIYTAGAITCHHRNSEVYKAICWRRRLTVWCEDLGIKLFDPTINYIREVNHEYAPRLCVDQNDYYINKSDICVVNMDSVLESPGTIYELVKFKMAGKPVIAFGAECWSPHVNSCISHHAKDMDEVKEVLVNMFDQGNM